MAEVAIVASCLSVLASVYSLVVSRRAARDFKKATEIRERLFRNGG